MAVIYLAGGCFWGMERLFRSLPGVTEVTAGYANGDLPEHARYEIVCTGATGFREAVRVEYDPAGISLEHLLFAFFASIDTETPHRQGPDIGSQYQSGVYWADKAAEGVVRRISGIEAAGVPYFAVELKPLASFSPPRRTTSDIWISTPAATAMWVLGNWRLCPDIPSVRRAILAPPPCFCGNGGKKRAIKASDS